MTPTRTELENVLLELIGGHRTRESVSDWARTWTLDDAAEIDDSSIAELLDSLHGADIKTSPETYLHGRADFEAWLERLRARGGSPPR